MTFNQADSRLERNVTRLVAVQALRKIRCLVDNETERKFVYKRRALVLALLLIVTVVGMFAAAVVFKG